MGKIIQEVTTCRDRNYATPIMKVSADERAIVLMA